MELEEDRRLEDVKNILKTLDRELPLPNSRD